MTKKVFLSAVIGILLIFATACGNMQNEKQTATVDSRDQSKSVFSNSVFLGDSLLLGLVDVLEDSAVIANAGATALFALKEVDNIANKNPDNVFIMLGSDDLLWPVDNPVDESIKNYTKLIEKIQGKLPNVKVHVLSVPPVTKEVMEGEPRYKNIPEYNKALERMAATKKIDYFDLSPIFEKNENLYSEDGIHFKDDFYPLFLNHLNEHIHSSNNNEGERDE